MAGCCVRNPDAVLPLLARRHWIFDLDGTLTVAVHNFPAMRCRLGVPPGADLIDWIDAHPKSEACRLHRALDAIEHEYAALARPAAGAGELLSALSAAGCRLGLLTRNTHEVAACVLRTLGLDLHFADACLYGRHDAPPKPRPDGILQLLRLWQADAGDTVMVGDHLQDLLSGRAAGTATVLVGALDPPPDWQDHLDRHDHSLNDLLADWHASRVSVRSNSSPEPNAS